MNIYSTYKTKISILQRWVLRMTLKVMNTNDMPFLQWHSIMIDLDVLEESPPRPMAEDWSPLGSLCRTFPDVLGAITVTLSDSSVCHNFQPYGRWSLTFQPSEFKIQTSLFVLMFWYISTFVLFHNKQIFSYWLQEIERLILYVTWYKWFEVLIHLYPLDHPWTFQIISFSFAAVFLTFQVDHRVSRTQIANN